MFIASKITLYEHMQKPCMQKCFSLTSHLFTITIRKKLIWLINKVVLTQLFVFISEGNRMETTDHTQVSIPRVDTHLGKFSQGSTVLLTALAFLSNQPIIVIVTAIIMALSAFVPEISPYRLVYNGIVVPLGLLKPRIVEDDPSPHRFAQGVGMVFLVASAVVLFLTPLKTVGWILDLIVCVLSGINFTSGFCLGCFVYYHLGRSGLLPRVRYTGGFHWRGV